MTQKFKVFNPLVGQPIWLQPNLRLVLAPNSSPMTYKGTNTYLLGKREIAVIDPGPEDNNHFRSILSALTSRQIITHILVTHSHLDHSPLARRLSQETGAKVYGFGPTGSGQSNTMKKLVASGYKGGGEGSDKNFDPDISKNSNETIYSDEWKIIALHTPGHFGNHLCFIWGDAVFTGDLVMNWASSLVSPPQGDLSDFMASCRKLMLNNWRIFYPGHGEPVYEPKQRLLWLINHRKEREANILSLLQKGPSTPQKLTQEIYSETQPNLLLMAERNVFAHLIDLCERNIVRCIGELHPKAKYELLQTQIDIY